MEDELLAALQARFGHTAFRPGQREVVCSVLEGRPTIAVLPTGAGKSLCYQLPAVLCPGTAVVISPLIALMKDQVDALRARGIAAARITSADAAAERRDAEARLAAGALDLIYVAPERLRSESFLQALSHAKLALVAVDEAHCVSEWGHDFRPDYLRIKPLLERLRPPRLAAFTATATPELRDELGVALGMEEPALFVRGFNRPNIHLRVQRARNETDRLHTLENLVRGRDGVGPALVYVATRKQAEHAAAALAAAGFAARHYHAGMDGAARHAVQEDFLGNRVDAMVATNAFGMGIDKPDVRLLVHLALPASLEAYYQEVGRAGRDTQPALAVLLYTFRDARTQEFLIQRDDAETELELDPGASAARASYREGALRRLQRMLRYAAGSTCRRRTILDYFGDPDAANFLDGCGSCDRCLAADSDRQPLDETRQTLVRMALSGVARAGGRVGRGRIAAMLAGRDTQAVRQLGFHRLSTFGLLEAHERNWIMDLLDALEEAGLVRTHGSQYPVLGLTERGAAVMRNEERAVMSWPGPPQARPPRQRASRSDLAPVAAEPTTSAPAPLASDVDSRIYQALADWRLDAARSLQQPAYCVLSNATLREIARFRPANLEQLAAMKGIGPSKLERYGAALLEVLDRF